MIRIFFKTIWNNRKRNILVFIELFVISLVLVNFTVFLVNIITLANIKNCYDAHNVIIIKLSRKNAKENNTTNQSLQNLKMKFVSDPDVESVSISDDSAVPYYSFLASTGFKYENTKINLATRHVDIDYAKVMKITPLRGRWFDETDIGKSVLPIIISKDIEVKYFQGNSVGKKIMENRYEIVGVVDHFKRNDIEKPYSFGFVFRNNVGHAPVILIRTKEDKTGDILAKAESLVNSVLNPEIWTIKNINSLENMRGKQNYESAQKYYLSLIIALFIMINVFLGVLGILWYNTNLRIHEIGIKRALGATETGINRLLLAENMFIAGLGLLIVILIFIQVPTFIGTGKIEPEVLTKSIWISMFTKIILVLLSTWIPSSLASKIHPATALKTE
jgi:putative ABC transport system permease protein